MAGVGALVLLFFGILGRDGDTTFVLSRKDDIIQLPEIVVDSATLGIIAGVLMLAMAGYSLALAIKNRKSPRWLAVIYGFVGVVSLLAYLATGNNVPVAFIAGTALVLAVPIMLGSMGTLRVDCGTKCARRSN